MTNENIDQTTSRFISISRFLMIYGLVIHHIFTIPGSSSFPRHGLSEYTHLIPEAISALVHMSFMVAVPMLSVISGYLFFSSKQLNYLHVAKKKFWSIALPYIIWCSAWLAFAYALYLVGHDRGLFEWANYHFDQFSTLHLINGIIGFSELPFAFQFWFIHDIVITFLLLPIIYHGLKKLKVAFVLICFLVWGLKIEVPIFFSFNVFFFFVIGGYIALSPQISLRTLKFNSTFSLIFIGLFLSALILRAWTSLLIPSDLFIFNIIRSEHFLLLLRLLGVIAFFQFIWWIVDHGRKSSDVVHHLSSYSFIIFAMHFPIIEFVKIAFSKMPGQATSIGVFLTWLLVPIITITICIIGAIILKKISPPLLSLLNGKRDIH